MKSQILRKYICVLALAALLFTVTDSWARLPKPIQIEAAVVFVDHNTQTVVVKPGEAAKKTEAVRSRLEQGHPVHQKWRGSNGGGSEARHLNHDPLQVGVVSQPAAQESRLGGQTRCEVAHTSKVLARGGPSPQRGFSLLGILATRSRASRSFSKRIRKG